MTAHRDSTVLAAQQVAQRVAGVVDRAATQLAATGPVTGRARSADGSIAVVVSPGGVLLDVRLTPAALQRGSADLAREVVTLAARATRQASERVHRAVSAVLDQDTARALGGLCLLPPEPDHDAPPRRAR